ncbi:phage tail tape measure protein [Pseudomonas fluorescens]|uniref:phage tail tape measure protein n=1 Tax=Pseudomonas fluorescens TaxID=294 RepID=UPI001BEBA01C|nr:phage tail tape measure protein [Pseudomonas fluorescens]MBT2374870.1 phage tail tape measure protein [Pseudomonas fluorescens]
MTGNITSMESLMQAEGLLERAKKGGLVTAEEQLKYQEQLGKAFDKIEKAEAKETAQKQRLIDAENRQIEALKRTVNGIDPVTAKLAKLEAQEKAAHEAFRAGAIDVEAYNAALAKVGKDRAGVTEVGGAFDKLKLGTRQAQENVMQLSNAIQSGDWGSGARAIAQLGAGAGASMSSMLAIAAPIGIVTAAIGGLAYAYYKGSEEQNRYNKSLILTGNYAGTTSSALGAMAGKIGDTVGTTGAAAEVLAQLAGSGKIVSSSFEHIAVAALSFEKATGKAASETVDEFAKLADDPVKAVVALNDKYNFLTAATYTQIRALQEQGDTLGAQQLAETAYADALIVRADTITSNLGTVESAWNAVKGAAKDAWDAVLDIGREETFDQKFEKLADRLNTLRNAKSNPMIMGDNPDMMMLSRGESGAQSDITAMLQKEVDDQAEARRKMFQGQDIQAGTKAYETLQNNLDATASKSAKLTKALEENQRRITLARQAGYTFTAAEEAALEKQTRDKFKDPKTAATQVDLTAFNSAKNNLADIANDYKNAQKELEAAQKAGLVSQGDYATRRAALIKQESVDVAAAYEAEIAALEATKGKKTTSAAQSIQLDQKIADARAGMVKAQKDADSQLEVLATAEKGRIDKQTHSINQYVAALGQQQKALELAGQRAVLGVGQGDRQNALNGELNSQQDRFAQQSLELANQKSDPSRNMSDEEFSRKSQALADANKKATDQIRQNYADVAVAQGDWTKGATSAWANYLDSAQNVAGQTKSLFGNAFGSMEDSIVNFAMTGKLSFADFTKSILADMARIATRQAASGLLGSLVGLGVSAAGSYFGGAASGGSTTAGYTGTDLSNFTPGSIQAKGGAWSGGVQMFADGGAFTNSVVSKPTAFGMANGKTGVMGEAGDEAIMPLTRTANGKLGVMSVGGGGGGTSISLSMPIMLMTDEESGKPDGAELDTELFQRNMQERMRTVAKEEIAKSWRQGGVSSRNVKG